MTTDELYITRCFELAKLGGKATKTNPMVGAVLVHDNRIIGEGYHKAYGGPHAEVNCLNSVKEADQSLIPDSTLFVSLEPCCFHGKTPACTNLILENGIKDVRISAMDPFPEVNGKGLQILKDKGVKITQGILEERGKRLIEKFVYNNMHKRPYIILKIVESQDGFIGQEGKQVWLSNKPSKILSHKWRSEVDGIMIGTNTAVIDNPRLTTRLYPGDDPIRIVFDNKERIPKTHHLLSDSLKTTIITASETYNTGEQPNKTVLKLNTEENQLKYILERLYKQDINSLIVEGGANLIKSFVKIGLWDECRVIRCKKQLNEGIKSPLVVMKYAQKYELDGDLVVIGYPAEL